MNWNDLIIIYLACGAPFTVYYFIQDRNLPEKNFLYLKTLFRFVFWVPYALQVFSVKNLLTKFDALEFDGRSNLEAKTEAKLFSIQKNLEVIFGEIRPRAAIYEFREIFERYVGLTREMQTDKEEVSPSEKEFFRIAKHENKKLGEICLHRRNRRRLIFHQNLARMDFFDILAELIKQVPGKQKVFNEASKLFLLLNDDEGNNLLREMFKESMQTDKKESVSILEKDLWKADQQKQSPPSLTTTNLQVLTVRTKSSGKD